MSTVQKIVLTALLVSLSFTIAEFMKLFTFLRMSNGGSVSLSMLPIFLLAYAIGPKYGVLGGVVYGFLNYMFDGGYAFHWVSLPFDYIFAFGVLGIVGLVAKSVKKGNLIAFLLSMFVATTLRTIFSTISGMLAWEATFWQSLAYNAIYCYLSFVLCAIVGFYVKKPFFEAIKMQEKKQEC